MADTKISALTSATAVANTDTVPLVQAGQSRKATLTQINRKVTNQSTANQSPAASSATLLTGSTLAIPSGQTIGADTTFQWKIILSKTAAGAVANTFDVRFGTAGTTADTSRLTFTTNVGTAAADVARIDILVTVRTTGASGIVQGSFTLTKSIGAAAGFINQPGQTIAVTSGAFALNTANLIASVSMTPGAGMVTTVSQVAAEVVNI